MHRAQGKKPRLVKQVHRLLSTAIVAGCFESSNKPAAQLVLGQLTANFLSDKLLLTTLSEYSSAEQTQSDCHYHNPTLRMTYRDASHSALRLPPHTATSFAAATRPLELQQFCRTCLTLLLLCHLAPAYHRQCVYSLISTPQCGTDCQQCWSQPLSMPELTSGDLHHT
jgi:hypothetical protein